MAFVYGTNFNDNDTTQRDGTTDRYFSSLQGTDSSDYIYGYDGNDILYGLNESDRLYGSSGNDTLDGSFGSDTLDGGSGADKMYGGDGGDDYYVDNVGDTVSEYSNDIYQDNVYSSISHTLGFGIENLTLTGTLAIDGTGNSQDNYITGNDNANKLNGFDGNDTIYGGAGNDTLTGWSGADRMMGELGNDTYFVENVGDGVYEDANEGVDTVSSKITFNLSYRANVENLTLTGSASISGTGNSQANVIIGNNASNQLDGGDGNDTINGGLGTNQITSGTGNDILKFTTKGHIDTITDYNVANDTIQLENSVFNALTTTGTLNASQFKIGAQAADANDFIIYNNTTGALLYDADGSGATAATQIATLSAGLNLTNADIVVI